VVLFDLLIAQAFIENHCRVTNANTYSRMRRTNFGTTSPRYFRINVVLVNGQIQLLSREHHSNGMVTLSVIVLTRVYSYTRGLKLKTLLVLGTDKSKPCMHELH